MMMDAFKDGFYSVLRHHGLVGSVVQGDRDWRWNLTVHLQTGEDEAPGITAIFEESRLAEYASYSEPTLSPTPYDVGVSHAKGMVKQLQGMTRRAFELLEKENSKP